MLREDKCKQSTAVIVYLHFVGFSSLKSHSGRVVILFLKR